MTRHHKRHNNFHHRNSNRYKSPFWLSVDNYMKRGYSKNKAIFLANQEIRKRGDKMKQRINFNWIKANWLIIIEIPFALLSAFILGVLIFYFNPLVILPIIITAGAGSIIRWIYPHAQGMWLVFHTLALSGLFMAILLIALYRLFAPVIQGLSSFPK